ncbi:methyltransferase-like protein 27 [Haliotis rubra]|uniref:methyltransferase-like protein 27 n=1 Tax=Haliotis rubra TaxID=36100 RepID=UPI001EE5A5C7|nr:methyltransferase-like protein 27 [Haliotis rubra]
MTKEEANKCTHIWMPEESGQVLVGLPYRAGLPKEEVLKFYSKWAADGKYEQDLCLEDYKGPVIAANALAKHFGSSIPQTKVLDVASGTGMVGKQLQDRGFKHLDALEPAAGMLEQARKKNIYTNLYCEFLDGKRLPIDDGGLVCIVMKESYLSQCKEYMEGLEQLMKELEDAGKWKRLSRHVVPKYSYDDNGVIFRFRIC